MIDILDITAGPIRQRKPGHTTRGADGDLPMMTVGVQAVFDRLPEKIWE
jgi:hypothetical protein